MDRRFGRTIRASVFWALRLFQELLVAYTVQYNAMQCKMYKAPRPLAAAAIIRNRPGALTECLVVHRQWSYIKVRYIPVLLE